MWIAALLLAVDFVAVDGSLSAEGRMGASPIDAHSTVGSTQLDGYAGMIAKFSDIQLSGGYSPRMIEMPPPQGNGFSLYHTARLGIQYSLDPTTHLLLQQLGSIGRNDFSPLIATGLLRPTTAVPVDPRLPVRALLAIGSSDSSVSWDQELSRRTTINATAGYSIYGGTDRSAQLYIPLQRGPRATANLSWLAAPSDVLSLTASGSHQAFTNGARSTLGSLIAGWKTDLGRNTRADIGVGTAFGATTGISAGGAPTPFPAASAGITHTFAMRGSSVSANLRAGASPQVDRTTGTPYEVATGSAGLGWNVDRNLTLSAAGAFGRALSGIQQVGSQLVTAEGSGQYRIDQLLQFSMGLRSAWQSLPPATPGTLTLPGFQWVVYAHLTFVLHGSL